MPLHAAVAALPGDGERAFHVGARLLEPALLGAHRGRHLRPQGLGVARVTADRPEIGAYFEWRAVVDSCKTPALGLDLVLERLVRLGLVA